MVDKERRLTARTYLLHILLSTRLHACIAALPLPMMRSLAATMRSQFLLALKIAPK
jgi:hypothetical protein